MEQLLEELRQIQQFILRYPPQGEKGPNRLAMRPVFESWLRPDLGVTTITIRNTGGTDHQSFDQVGLPGFQFMQDEVEYGRITHHSNMDATITLSRAT